MISAAAPVSYDDELRAIARDAPTTDLASVENALYAFFYCRPREAAREPSTRDEQMRFLGDLSFANCGTGHWATGWNMAAREGNSIVAVRRGFRLYADPGDVRTSGEFGPASRCRVRAGKELRGLMRGFYCAVGNADGNGDPDVPLVRLYWNLDTNDAATYIALTTSLFNIAEVPFLTKVLSDPNAYIRADSGVLYIERTRVREAAPLVHQIYEELAPLLHDDVPMFTKRLAPGLAWAEDPGSDSSFGQTRCYAIAQGLRACADRSHEPDVRYRSIRESLHAAGIDPGAPYLCGGRDDTYDCLAIP